MNPGPATAHPLSRSFSESASAAPTRSAISRGAAPSDGARSMATLVE